MAADIGVTLFVELLQMSQYPGSPFTGNLYRDLIMFLIVPTVFIIMVIYTMTGRIIADNRFRIMIGVTAYLFIIASGYYPAFALLAGPYFVFLIFILGLLYFIGGHFRAGRGGGGGGGSGAPGGFSHQSSHSYDGEGGGFSKKVGTFEVKRRHQLEKDIRGFEEDIRKAEKRLEHLPRTADRAIQAENDRIANAEREIRKLRRLLDRDVMD